jgi:hypothetical protein
MNTHPENKETLALNLLAGGNSPDAKPSAVLAGARYFRLGYSVRPLAAL